MNNNSLITFMRELDNGFKFENIFEEKSNNNSIKRVLKEKKENDKYIVYIDAKGLEKEKINLDFISNENCINFSYNGDYLGEKIKIDHKYKLSKNYDVENSQAKLSNGILEIQIPLLKPISKKIDIIEN